MNRSGIRTKIKAGKICTCYYQSVAERLNKFFLSIESILSFHKKEQHVITPVPRDLAKALNDKIFPEGGGQLIRDSEGNMIGAVGVTGETEELNDELAVHGIRVASLKTDVDFPELGNKFRLS